MPTLLLVALLCGLAAAAAASTGSTYTNPVNAADSPDPGVLLFKGTWYAVTTTGDGADHFNIFTSSDLVAWGHAGYIFPRGSAGAPTWAASDYWAPELHVIDGRIVAYFAARDHAGVLSVGAATAPHPLGPFQDVGAPLVSEAPGGFGNIDPTYFSHGGQGYLIWKRDGNAVLQPTPIFSRPLAANGTVFADSSPPVQLITNTLSWEQPLVEAPWMVERNGTFYLFYSGQYNARYSVGVARSSSPTGPFTKLGPPILTTTATNGNSSFPITGSGHCSVVTAADGSTQILYHSWPRDAPVRTMMMDEIVWTDAGWPSVANGRPSVTAQPVP